MKYGIYVIVISAIPTLIAYRKYWIKCFTVYLIPILFYFIIFENILFPLWKVAPGSEREKYSIPFQQTARYIKDFEVEVTQEEKEIINKIFVYEDVARVYNPQTSDAVKFHAFRGIQSEEDMQEYLKIWFSMLWKHPGVYVEAAMNECFGFFYPGFTEHWTNYYEFTNSINNFGNGFFEIYHPEKLSVFKTKLTKWGACFEFLPFLKMLYRSGSYMWILLWATSIVIICKKTKYLIALSPLLGTVLVCITSPYNANTRYALPLIFGIGYTIGIALKAIKER